jgi:hypothetical protein
MLIPILIPNSAPIPMKIKLGSKVSVNLDKPTRAIEIGSGDLRRNPSRDIRRENPAIRIPVPAGESERLGFLARLPFPLEYIAFKSFTCGDVSREAQIINLNHLPFQRDCHKQSQDREFRR